MKYASRLSRIIHLMIFEENLTDLIKFIAFMEMFIVVLDQCILDIQLN